MMPLMKNAGVPFTPDCMPAAMDFSTTAAFFPLSRHSSNFAVSSPSSFARLFRSAMPILLWFSNIFLLYSKYLPWSPAQCAASCAFFASLWNESGKSMNTYFTLPSYSSISFQIVCLTLWQNGHW